MIVGGTRQLSVIIMLESTVLAALIVQNKVALTNNLQVAGRCSHWTGVHLALIKSLDNDGRTLAACKFYSLNLARDISPRAVIKVNCCV